jgi:MFS family permease
MPLRTPVWHAEAPYGHSRSVDSAGTIAAPLLAGFTITMMTFVVEHHDLVRWADIALLVLVSAAILLLISVQCAYSARRYAVIPSELVDWWPDIHDDDDRLEMVREEQWGHAELYTLWVRRFTNTFNAGILLVLVGLMLVLLPPDRVMGKPADISISRYFAVSVSAAGVVLELLWIIATWGVGGSMRAKRKPQEASGGRIARTVRGRLFKPKLVRQAAEWLVAPIYLVDPPGLDDDAAAPPADPPEAGI